MEMLAGNNRLNVEPAYLIDERLSFLKKIKINAQPAHATVANAKLPNAVLRKAGLTNASLPSASSPACKIANVYKKQTC